MSATPVETARRAPALVEAVLHPERFFRDSPLVLSRALLVTLVLSMGISSWTGSDRRAELLLIRDASYDRWAYLWGTAVAGGLVIGVIGWFVRGFWYGVRVRWSGGPAPLPRECRAISGICDAVAGLPAVVSLFANAAIHESPLRALRAGGGWWSVWSLVVLGGWSIWMSYQAATTRFVVDRKRARFWFLILPALLGLALAILAYLRLR